VDAARHRRAERDRPGGSDGGRVVCRGAGQSERPDAAAATPLGAAWLEAAESSDGVAARRDARLAELDAGIARVRELLANEAFTSRAPIAVVERERARLVGLEEERRQLSGG
jgi:hypothetical protein